MPGRVLLVAALSGTPAHLGFLSPSEGLASFGRCFVETSGCLHSPKALGLFLSLFHADIYSCSCAGGMKTNPSSPHPLPPVFPSPQSPDVDRVQGHKENPFLLLQGILYPIKPQHLPVLRWGRAQVCRAPLSSVNHDKFCQGAELKA